VEYWQMKVKLNFNLSEIEIQELKRIETKRKLEELRRDSFK
jgi:hypothetical protein